MLVIPLLARSKAAWTNASEVESKSEVASQLGERQSKQSKQSKSIKLTEVSRGYCSTQRAGSAHSILSSASALKTRTRMAIQCFFFPARTSSNSKIWGFLTMARAMAQRCRCPPLSCSPFNPTRSDHCLSERML